MDNVNVKRRYIARLGIILFNYSMLGFILSLLGVLGSFFVIFILAIIFLFIMLYYIFLIFTTVITAGILWLAEEYRQLWVIDLDWLSSSSSKISEILPKIIDAVPIFASVIGVLCITSFCCLLADRKWEKARSRLFILVAIFIALVSLIVLVLAGIVVGGNK